MDEIAGTWHLETLFPDVTTMLKVTRVLFSGQTEYQTVEVLESERYGKSLMLDGKTQSAEADEHIYHESLVHPAMLTHRNPRTVFIGGGGEGGTLREVLSHPSVEQVVMIDLDQEVVEVCRRFLPNYHQGAFDDPRLELLHQDARAYLRDTQRTFDVMIMDLVDPMEGGPAYLLYTKEYYDLVQARLNPGGVLVTQSGPAGLLNHQECFTTIVRTLRGNFAHVRPYHVEIPSFYTHWGFTIASDAPLPSFFQQPDDLDAELSQRLPNKALQFYDGETHQSMFNLPRFLRQGIHQETRINLDAAPVFMT